MKHLYATVRPTTQITFVLMKGNIVLRPITLDNNQLPDCMAWPAKAVYYAN